MKNVKIISTMSILLFATTVFAQDLAVYVSDAGNFNVGPWQIAKFDDTGNFEGSLITGNDNIVWPQDIIFLDTEEAVLISSLSAGGIISKHDWASGDLIENFAEGLGGPTRMKLGSDGLLYVLQWSNSINKVLRFQLDGTFVDEFTSVGVQQSIGLDWDANGDLYVASYGNSTIRKFDGTTGADLGLFIDSGLNGPTNIFFEATGNLIVFDYNTGIIKRFDASGNFIEDVITGLSGPEGFAFFPNGDLLIGNGGDGSVKRYDSNYNFLGDFIAPGTLLTPNAIVIRDDVPLGVQEFKQQKIFVTPTLGSTFTFNPEIASQYENLHIYDSIGKLVETIITSEKTSWDAHKLAEGTYFMVGRKNGQKANQTIIISK